MKLNPGRFNRHLANIGQQLTWRRAYSCACVNPESGAPDHKHQLCMGKGWLWADPVLMVCGVSKQEITPEMIAAGVFENGDLTLTIPSNTAMWDGAGRFDRVRLLNSTDVFSQPFKHGHVSERLLFTVVKFDRCFWLDPVTRNIVEGGLPVADANGLLTWPNGGEPPLGYTYSLTGSKYDEYFVLDSMPSDRNEHSGAPLPKKLQMRKWDLFNR